MLNDILKVLQHEFKLELRNKSALGGLLIYAFSTVFVIYLSTTNGSIIDIWVALIWMAILFVSINAAGKSLLQEQKERLLYYFSVVDPRSFILGKIAYASLLVSGITMLIYLVFYLLFDSPVTETYWFLAALILGGSGFAATISFISAVAMSASGNFTLVSILSFPVLLPFLMTQLKLSKLCVSGFDSMQALKLSGVLLLLNVLVWALSYLLFPYLWRD